ncbi:hypothetical protein BLOT_010147 [Blomia tropicalis]|nr:hypothetical protein BLOT_010147 [Blomia tropicalis]
MSIEALKLRTQFTIVIIEDCSFENKNNKKLRFRTFILYSSMGTFGYVGVDHAIGSNLGYTVTVKVLRRKCRTQM